MGQGDGELARGARRTTTQGELTRQRTLDVAGQMFADVGYAETKLEDIAARVGVTKGAILRHFGSKEQLFVAAYKHVMTVNPSWLDVPADVLEGGFFAVLSFWLNETALRTPVSLPVRMYFLGRSCGDRNAQQQINRYLRSEDPDRTLEFVEFGLSKGEIVPTHDPLLVAAFLDWTIDGYQGSALSDDLDRSGLFRGADKEQSVATAQLLVEMLKRAFAA